MINILVSKQESLLLFLRKIRRFLVIKQGNADSVIAYLLMKKKRRKQRNVPFYVSTGHKLWSKKDLKSLQKYVSLGWNNTMISNQMKRGRNSIASKVSRLKLRK